MTIPNEIWQLPTQHIGRQIHFFEEIDSTNNYAADLAGDVANDGIVALAARQTHGRGQHGRVWHSPRGASVLMSVLCFPPPPIRHAPIITAWAAVSVCQLVEQWLQKPAAIKWPNDVLVNGKKICGILTEQARGTIVGIGLNINQSAEEFLAVSLPEATSFLVETTRQTEYTLVVRRLVEILDHHYHLLLHESPLFLENAWKKHLHVVGHRVVLECLDCQRAGRLVEAAFDGLLLETSDHRHERIMPEKVQHIWRA